jgi:hypothetical protein
MVLYARALAILAEDHDPGTALGAMATAAQDQALSRFRSRRDKLSGPRERLLFAQVAFLATVSRFTAEDEAAPAAATDFTDQMYPLSQKGLRLFPGEDVGNLLEELGFAEYVIARGELARHDVASFAQHLRQAKDLLDRHPQPAEMSAPMVRIKREIAVFLATHDRA